MTEITRKITVDLARRGNVRLIFARQNDFNSRRINIKLTDGGAPFFVEKTSVAIVNFLRSDGTSGAFNGVIEDDGSVSIVLGVWQLAVVGEVKCSVSIFSDEKKITSSDFFLDVEIALYIGEGITEDENYSMLTSLMSEIAKINVTEDVRKKSESSRALAEENRVKTESDRQSAEAARERAEILRENAEMTRVSAEQLRAEIERGRISAELARVDAENQRTIAEDERACAENKRNIKDEERNNFLGDLEGAIDEISEVQKKILEGDITHAAREEIIAAIKANMLIADDLNTNDPYKALSAAQGVVLKNMVAGMDKMESGYYNGTGEGSAEIVFSFVPRIVFIIGRLRRYNSGTYSLSIETGWIFPEKSVGIIRYSGAGEVINVTLNGTVVTLDNYNTKSTNQSGIDTEADGYGYWYYAIG